MGRRRECERELSGSEHSQETEMNECETHAGEEHILCVAVSGLGSE